MAWKHFVHQSTNHGACYRGIWPSYWRRIRVASTTTACEMEYSACTILLPFGWGDLNSMQCNESTSRISQMEGLPLLSAPDRILNGSFTKALAQWANPSLDMVQSLITKWLIWAPAFAVLRSLRDWDSDGSDTNTLLTVRSLQSCTSFYTGTSWSSKQLYIFVVFSNLPVPVTLMQQYCAGLNVLGCTLCSTLVCCS